MDAPKSYYLYNPSEPLAGVVAGLYGVSFCITLWQIIRKKAWVWLFMLLAIAMEVIGYAARVVSATKPTEKGPYVLQFTLVILPPVLMAGVIYVIFARIVFWVVPPESRTLRFLWVPARFITLLFVGFDIISLLLQLVAAVLIAGTDPTDPDAKSKLNLGKTLGLVGVSTQIAGFGLFTVSAIRFHFAARRLSPDFAKDNQEKHGIVKKWQTLLIVVNVSCLLILVRSIYREIDFAGGKDGTTHQKEWYLYVFDTLPILLVVFLYNVFFPGSYLKHLGFKVPKESQGAVLDAETADKQVSNTAEKRFYPTTAMTISRDVISAHFAELGMLKRPGPDVAAGQSEGCRIQKNSSQEHHAKPTFEIKQLPRPVPGPNEVLIRLSLTSLCGSDLGMALGHMGPVGKILGHEGVGKVAELGSNISHMDPSVQVGQRVGIAWIRDICGSCSMCIDIANEGETRCVEALHSAKAYDGTFAEYTLVPLRYLARIPPAFDDIPDEEIAPILCGGVTAYKAIKNCNLTPGQWVVISGAGGGVGALGVAYAHAMGYRVIAVDAGPGKEEYCKSQGAEHYVDALSGVDAGKQVKDLTDGQGAKAVVVTATAAAAYQKAFDMLGPFGTLMCVSILPEDVKINFHPLWFIDNGWTVKGSAVGTRADILEALQFVKRRLVIPKIKWANLEDIEGLMEQMSKGQLEGKYVMKL
ncbi:alcohol dehydrogenase 2 [Fusarium pseudoanthophilum]|uniref:Alcohol dehydrogenase 2 n=1 Tax=Fusarium pseudoanthophilum TaxID=48495 RepID=A0A8H5V1R7_9HYPO|nr:alcohol dehydrogenase 2 [Fusarium pseudoanthophilum]